MYRPTDFECTSRWTSLEVATNALRSAGSSAAAVTSDPSGPTERVLVVIGSERTAVQSKEFAWRFANQGRAEIHVLRPVGADPALEVRREALALGVDWLCMVTHDEPGLMTLFLNNEDEAILRAAPCPVVCIPESELARTVLWPVKRILVATSSPADSHDMMLSAVELARRFKAKIDLLGVEELVRQPFDSPALTLSGMRRARRIILRDQLAQLRGRVVPKPRRGRLKVSLGLPFFYATIWAARELESDLIVVSAPTRLWEVDARIDVETERILRGATCPVICLPERDVQSHTSPHQESRVTLLRNAAPFRAHREQPA